MIWGWGEILAGSIAILTLAFGILYSKEYHEKNSKKSSSGDGTIIGELLAATLTNSPYYVLKAFFILIAIFILVCIVISKM
ncbi:MULTISPECIES: hypothetical protein [unclassified Sporosarcina]|uniref:hypothetical protein n=1 Tax=unclassified Sporosarcina TaxID=2647733 RepID=UPI000C167CC8|nr:MULTISPECIES: hypothetical protein [unclassified Sporosarcina]PID01818.1 hypothetical protein CSV67_12145 [Sporosarcina sp. P2]PID24790.1 hypothetical protein CSV60_07720 [Sporosarcina sp. P7]